MKPYHKIQSVYKRDPKTHRFMEGDFSLDVFQYLFDLPWTADEKIDGTNIRVHWDMRSVRFGGRTDNAQIQTNLLGALQDSFPAHKFSTFKTEITLYGEGCGEKIQKNGGEHYGRPKFILFDVAIGDYWLKREDIEHIARQLNINVAPVLMPATTLRDAVYAVKNRNLKSYYGDFIPEGLILRPAVQLFNRHGNRIITKIKVEDFDNPGEKK